MNNVMCSVQQAPPFLLHVDAFHKASGPCLQLPATAIHDIATASVILRNTTPEPQTFEFSIPQGSDMTLSPHVDTIKGGGSLRVMLRYCPQPSTAPAVPAESELQPAEPSGAAPEGNAGSTGAGIADAADTAEVRMRHYVSIAYMSTCSEKCHVRRDYMFWLQHMQITIGTSEPMTVSKAYQSKTYQSKNIPGQNIPEQNIMSVIQLFLILHV